MFYTLRYQQINATYLPKFFKSQSCIGQTNSYGVVNKYYKPIIFYTYFYKFQKQVLFWLDD